MNKGKLRRLFDIFWERYTGSELNQTSVLIAFYVLLSLFPLFILLGNLLPYLPVDVESLIVSIELILPDPLEPLLEPIMRDLLTDSSGGLIGFGAVGLLWSASRGINYMQVAMNKAYGVKIKTSFVAKRAISVLIILVLFLVAAAFIIVFSFGTTVLGWLAPVFEWARPLMDTLRNVRWPAVLAVMFVMLLVIYRIAPDVKVRLRDAAPGAALSTVGLVVLAEAFAIFVRFATRSFSSYGTLSSFFLLMFWMNFSAILIIAGAVLNASIQEYRTGTIEEETSSIDDYLMGQGRRIGARVKQRWEERRVRRAHRRNDGEEPGDKPSHKRGNRR